MNKQIENTMLKMTETYGRDMVCAVIAYNFDLGIDSYGMDPDEVMTCVDMDDLYETNEILSADFERLFTEQGEEAVNEAMVEYMNDDDRKYEQASKTAAPAVSAATAPVIGAPATAQAAAPQQASAPAPAPAPAYATGNSAGTQPVAAANSSAAKGYPNPVNDGFEAGLSGGTTCVTAFGTSKSPNSCIRTMRTCRPAISGLTRFSRTCGSRSSMTARFSPAPWRRRCSARRMLC